MELKHFSHSHGLVFQQLPQGSQPLCGGCKSPASGNVYICWQCRFFLHEQCFRAPRSLNHPSHPLHPLTLMPSPTYPSRSFICNSCNVIGDSFSYSCSQCDFDAHLHCALTPNIDVAHPKSPQSFTAQHFSHPHALKQIEMEQQQQQEKLTCSACTVELSAGTAYCCTVSNCTFNLHKVCFDAPREVHHKSHPHHPLTLLPAPPPYSGGFACNACSVSTAAFVYNCAACSYDLHIDCIQWPESITRPDHDHALSLYYSPPYDEGVVFGCDVCGEPVHQKRWMYCCRDCDYGTHPECVFSDRAVQQQQRQETADGDINVQVQMLRLQQMQMMNMNSQLHIQQLQMNMNSQLHMQRLTMQSSFAAHVRDSI